jgi:uncharacterized protein
MKERTGTDFCLRDGGNGEVILALYVQPKASRIRFVGMHGDELKLAITAPPVDGKANKAVISFLAKFFSLSKSDVVIQSGHQSRHKQCRLFHIGRQDVLNKIQGYL